MKILLTGGSGLLGTELQKHLEVIAPKHEEMDILNPDTYIIGKFDMIIHSAAYTNLMKAEDKEKTKCYMTNVMATKWLCEFYRNSKFIYISSEYASNPVNWYSWTKLWGENMVKEFGGKHLIIRTLFKPYPFPHLKACVDQWTMGDYVDIIAKQIVELIDKEGVIWTGTGRKTTYELAKRTRQDVEPCLVDDIGEIKLPKDYIL